MPAGALLSGVVVDDLGLIARVRCEELGKSGAAEEALDRAIATYARYGLAPKASKLQRQVVDGVLWGGTVDGRGGVVAAAREKLLHMGLVSLAVVQGRWLSLDLVRRVVGGWNFGLMFRRPFFALLDRTFRCQKRLADRPETERVALPAEVGDELLALALCTPLLRARVRAPFSPDIYAHDAEGAGGCAVGGGAGGRGAP